MRIPRPNWWAVSALVFNFVGWGLCIAAAVLLLDVSAHRSPAGFQHDLVARAEHWLRPLTPSGARGTR